jgi:hypothetical protein
MTLPTIRVIEIIQEHKPKGATFEQIMTMLRNEEHKYAHVQREAKEVGDNGELVG